MIYKRKEINDYEVFQIEGDFSIGNIGNIINDYTNLIQNDHTKFIFDLTNIDFIDSSGIGTILMGVSNALKKGDKIKICIDSSNENIRNTFNSVKLESVIDYHSSLKDALEGKNVISLED